MPKCQQTTDIAETSGINLHVSALIDGRDTCNSSKWVLNSSLVSGTYRFFCFFFTKVLAGLVPFWLGLINISSYQDLWIKHIEKYSRNPSCYFILQGSLRWSFSRCIQITANNFLHFFLSILESGYDSYMLWQTSLTFESSYS